jgi:hypothetical protein
MASPHLLAVLAVLNVPIYVAVLRAFFDDLAELAGGLWAWEAPPWARLWDALSGRWFDDQWAAAKLLVAGVLCGLLVLGEYSTVLQHAPALAHWLDQAW